MQDMSLVGALQVFLHAVKRAHSPEHCSQDDPGQVFSSPSLCDVCVRIIYCTVNGSFSQNILWHTLLCCLTIMTRITSVSPAFGEKLWMHPLHSLSIPLFTSAWSCWTKLAVIRQRSGGASLFDDSFAPWGGNTTGRPTAALSTGTRGALSRTFVCLWPEKPRENVIILLILMLYLIYAICF